MMYFKNIFILLLSILLLSHTVYSQFEGGDADGYGIGTIPAGPVNDQGIYCMGGNSDGYGSSSSGQLLMNEQGFYCSGGDADGYSVSLVNTILNLQDFYCTGGEGDGYHSTYLNTILNDQTFYCTGGDGDGYHALSANTSLNDQTMYCMGGDGDGYGAVFSGLITPNDPSIYCSGGNYDGYDMATATTTINDQYLYCYGGFRDGYDFAGYTGTMNEQYSYCIGGSGDGYDFDLYNGNIYGSALYAFGGDGDGYGLSEFSGNVFGYCIFAYGGDGDGYSLGEGSSLYLGVGLWTGITSTDWNTNTNWQHDLLPDIGDNVTIPSGCPNYPVLNSSLGIDTTQGFYECHAINIHPNASITSNGPIYVKGDMTLGGSFTTTMNGNNANRIYENGSLTVLSTGSMILGNQTTLWGLTDLEVYDGGILNIDGGTLHIDDQIHVYSGATLQMPDGELFVHKYGMGTGYSATNPGNFWVEAGALGGISGGTVRICGRTSTGGYHAFTILEPNFNLSGTATLKFEHGLYGTHYDCGINLADGVSIQNLTIDKPGNSVIFYSNATVPGNISVEPNSTLQAESGVSITVGP